MAEASAKEQAKKLIEEGWYQVSRKYRTLARLPKGETGIQALARAATKSRNIARDTREWAIMLGERSAGDHYLRVYAQEEGNWQEVSPTVFDWFRKLGGNTYY